MNTRPPPIVKITRPVLDGVFPRKRLFQLLERGRQKPILWVSGLPGCGKTTLVVSYLASRGDPCLWYQVDEGDHDIASFFYYMGLAAQRASPRKRKPLPFLTPEYLPGLPTFTKRYFENLYGRLNPGSVVVFDNYQNVPPESQFHEVIREGLSCLPDGINAFLISRSDPPQAFARERVHRRMEEIGWKELRLTSEETKGIACLRGRKRQTVEAIRHLHEATNGWAAGLVLMLERTDTREVDQQLLTNLTHREIFDYFESEIFNRTGRSLRQFLVKTAFLPNMTAMEAEKLTGQRRTAQLLSYISRNNYFLVEHPHSEPVYQYHSLFREFLLSRARDILGEKDAHALKQLAAALLEEAGRKEDAADLFCDIGDHESLTRLILANAPSLLAQGRNRILEAWLGHMPEKALINHPWLLFWLGACRMPYDPAGSMEHVERSFGLFWKGEDPVGTFLSWSLIMDILSTLTYDFKALDEWIDVFANITERYPSFPSPDIEARAVASLLGGLYMRRVDHPDIDIWVKKAESIIPKCRNIQIRLQGSLYLFLYFLWIGDFPKARVIVESTRQLISSSSLYPQIKIMFHLFEARLYCGVEQFDDSIKSVAKGLGIARSSGMHIWDFLFLAEGASASLGKGDLDSASDYIQKMSPILNMDQAYNMAYYYHLSSWYASLEGDMPLAISRSDTANELATDCGSPCSIALGNLHAARLRNEIGKPEETENHLERASDIARGMRSPILDYQCRLVEADLAFTRGEEKLGCDSLKKALFIGREKGYFHHENWIPSFMIRLCVKALKEGIEVPYVQELIRKRSLVPDPPPVEVETWPWPVRIYTLGQFGILKDGKPLAFSRKVQKRPLSLLKALVAFGGRAVREEQVSDTIWTDVEGDMAYQSMSVALRRLRQLLGHDESVQRKEGKFDLDPRYCWVDAFAFERLLGEAAFLEEKGMAKGAAELSEMALKLYRGPFLAGDAEQSWAISMRERLRSKYLRTVGRLGAHWQEARQWEKAQECYQKGLDVDNLAEEFYQSLITCYLVHGRKAEALAVYDRLRNTFSSLGVEPSPKTRDLLNSLRTT
jgi:ATP/maltotriose-dependent transcriptional regulator MalT